MHARVGLKLVGIGTVDFNDDGAAFDLWCPDGMLRHEVSNRQSFRQLAAGRERARSS